MMLLYKNEKIYISTKCSEHSFARWSINIPEMFIEGKKQLACFLFVFSPESVLSGVTLYIYVFALVDGGHFTNKDSILIFRLSFLKNIYSTIIFKHACLFNLQ